MVAPSFGESAIEQAVAGHRLGFTALISRPGGGALVVNELRVAGVLRATPARAGRGAAAAARFRPVSLAQIDWRARGRAAGLVTEFIASRLPSRTGAPPPPEAFSSRAN